MNYRQALDYLLRFADFERSGRFSSRPDVLPVESLLRHLGDPQRGRLTVHVAGSKGKGSTSAIIDSILRQCGLRPDGPVGLYTSPHLHSFRERIRVDGVPVSHACFTACADALEGSIEEVRREYPERELVTFDLLTAMAFLAFREARATAQVIETGLGGRVDSTNALGDKDVCVITPISFEHQSILGHTLPEIAAEKAGIIRAGSSVVMALQQPEAAAVIRDAAALLGAPLIEVGESCRIERVACDADGQEFSLKTPLRRYDLRLPLLGLHQLENAATAVLAVEALRERGVEASAEQVARGVAGVRWPGRLEVMSRRPLLIVDGAHNGESARRLRETLTDDLGYRKATFVIGVSSDKNLGAMASELRALAGTVFATSSVHPRAMPATKVAEALRSEGFSVTETSSVAEAVDAALAGAKEDEVVCVLGSLFVAAEARAHVLGIEEDAG